MMNFYKNVIEHKGKLLVRGIHEGKEYKEKLNFGPTLYALTQEHSVYKTLQGQYLKPIEFTSIDALLVSFVKKLYSKLTYLWFRKIPLSIYWSGTS